MPAISYLKYLRISPKKIKNLGRLTVGLSPQEALDRLSFTKGQAPKFLTQAILSAKANAVNNLKLNATSLIIKKVSIEKGPHFKRWQPQARGIAHPYKKRTTHLRVTIGEKEVQSTPNNEKLTAIKRVAKSLKEKITTSKSKEKAEQGVKK